jgi:hypothetical protein
MRKKEIDMWEYLGFTWASYLPNVVVSLVFLGLTYLIVERILKNHEVKQLDSQWRSARRVVFSLIEDMKQLSKNLTIIKDKKKLPNNLSPNQLILTVQFKHEDVKHLLYASSPLVEPEIQLALMRYEYPLRMLRHQLGSWLPSAPNDDQKFINFITCKLSEYHEVLKDIKDMTSEGYHNHTGLLFDSLKMAEEDLEKQIEAADKRHNPDYGGKPERKPG